MGNTEKFPAIHRNISDYLGSAEKVRYYFRFEVRRLKMYTNTLKNGLQEDEVIPARQKTQ